MRKQELLQLHRLFGELRRYLARQHDVRVPADAFAAYDEFGVTPMFIPAGKEAHATAVELLVNGLVTAISNHHDADEQAQTDADADAEGTVAAHPTD